MCAGCFWRWRRTGWCGCRIGRSGTALSSFSCLLLISRVTRSRPPPDADQVTSNTEGKIVGAELTLRLDEESTSLRVGDEITASGHFVGTAPE